MARKETIALLGFDDRWVLILGIPLMAFCCPLLFFDATLTEGIGGFLPKFWSSLLFTMVYWLTMRMIFIQLRRRFPSHLQVRRRVGFTLLLTLFSWLSIHKVLGWAIRTYLPHRDPPGITDFDYAVASLTIILLVSAIYEGVYLYGRWRESAIEQERLQRENIESQLAGLRSQVNPHFLFNSLNTLVCIIPEDPQRAVEFVRKMSKVYRYILEIRDTRLISLADELRFMEAYLFLLQERFSDNLQVRLNIPGVDHWQVVPLSLQILLENAIKHNIISSQRPLTIEIFTDNSGGLIVRNNLQKKAQDGNSTEVGLQNIRNRYSFFTDEAIEVTEGAGFFTVRLPLLRAPATIQATTAPQE